MGKRWACSLERWAYRVLGSKPVAAIERADALVVFEAKDRDGTLWTASNSEAKDVMLRPPESNPVDRALASAWTTINGLREKKHIDWKLAYPAEASPDGTAPLYWHWGRRDEGYRGLHTRVGPRMTVGLLVLENPR